MKDSLAEFTASITVTVDRPRLRVKPGKKFRGNQGSFGMRNFAMVPAWPVTLMASGSEVPFVNAVLPVPKNPMLRLLHTNQDEFFRAVIKQVFAEMPSRPEGE